MGRHMQSHIKASQEKNFLTIVNLQFHDNKVHKYSLYMYTFVTQTNLHVFQNSLWYEFGQANFFPKCHRKKKDETDENWSLEESWMNNRISTILKTTQ